MNDKVMNIEYMKNLFKKEILRRGWSKRSIETYIDDLNQFLSFIKSTTKIIEVKEITRKEVSNYQSYLFYYVNKHKKRYSINTQIKKLVIVRSFFEFLASTNRILVNPAKNIILPKEEKKLPKKPFTDKELEFFFNSMDTTTLLGFRDRVIFELFYTTGIRVTELINIKLNDLDLENNLLRVNGKGNKTRLVPLCRIMKEYLKKYIKEVRTEYKRKMKTPNLFITIKGKGFTDKNEIRMIMKKYCKKAGIKRAISTHHFRVSCATKMMEGGASVRHIQEMLGHEKLETTERYLKVNITNLKAEYVKSHPRENIKQ